MEKQKTNSVMDSKQMLDVLLAFKSGDFLVRMPKDMTGIDGKIADAFNDVIDINQKVAKAVDKVSKNVGR